MKLNGLINIVLVGDYSIFRNALRMLLESNERFKVIGEVAKLPEIADLTEKQKPDVILIDSPENGDSSNLLPLPNKSTENIPILFLTGSSDLQTYQNCLKLGINGLVVKDAGADVLFKAIEKIYQGEFWFDRALMGQTIKQLVSEKSLLHAHPRSSAHDGLSERETQVVNLICKGMKNRDIAGKLFITETTVRHHLTSIFEKLSISSRLELVIYAFKHNLVAVPTAAEVQSANAGANGI